MGKCEHVIEKGKRKNQICGIYTNKKIENKFYCSSHLNSHKPKEPITEKVIEDKKDSPILVKSLENGDSLDSVIEYEYSKIKDRPDNDNDNTKTNDIMKEINNINNKLFFLENQIKYSNNLDIPNYEIFK